MNAELFPIEM